MVSGECLTRTYGAPVGSRDLQARSESALHTRAQEVTSPQTVSQTRYPVIKERCSGITRCIRIRSTAAHVTCIHSPSGTDSASVRDPRFRLPLGLVLRGRSAVVRPVELIRLFHVYPSNASRCPSMASGLA